MPRSVCTLMVLAASVGTVLANVCFVGNEPDQSGRMRWVLPYKQPCDECTELRLGAVSAQAPRRPFSAEELKYPVVTKDRGEIASLLNCTAPLLKKHACEGSNFTISCEGGGMIDVKLALYGREDGADICRFKRVEPCGNATISLLRVREACQGHRDCTFVPNNVYFGDPCVHVGKYLVVHYVCLSEVGSEDEGR